MQRDYGHGAYGGQNQSASYGMESNDRFGPSESYDSQSSQSGRDLFRSGCGYNEPEQSRFGDGFDDGFENTYQNSHDNFGGRNQGGSRSQMRPGFMDDAARDGRSSYSSFTSPQMKPAPAGSRGRGMPAYPGGAFGGKRSEAFGGQSSVRGRGRGRRQMADFGGAFKAGMNQSKAGAAGRGMKRKNNPPGDKPTEMVGKKAKLAKPAAATNAVNNAANNASNKVAKSEVNNEEEEEKRKLEARRGKQKRRREKNNEKFRYGSRLAFTCSFCQYRTLEEKEMEAHLASATHKKTLDHIQKQTKFSNVVMEFLHECMVNKFKKTSLRKAQSNVATNTLQKNMMEGITDEDHMMKVDSVHCVACSLYVPALFSSVQHHLKSPEHAKSKVAYKEQFERLSVLTATSILSNPAVKARYEQFAKGENPFEIVEQSKEPVVEENEAQDATEQTDFSEDVAIDFTEDTMNFVEETENTTTFIEETATTNYTEDAPDVAEDSTDQIDFTADCVTTEEN